MDNRFGRFNYIAPGTVVQLQVPKNGKYVPFLTTYVWNTDKTANGPSEEMQVTCVDRLFWLKLCHVDVSLKKGVVGFNVSTGKIEQAATATTETPTPGAGQTQTVTSTEFTQFLGAQMVISKGARPDKLIRQVAKAHRIPLGVVPKTNTRITSPMDFPEQTTVLEYITAILRLTKTAEGKVRQRGVDSEGKPILVQAKAGRSVQFDVHARDGKLNVIPIKVPSKVKKVVRFTDDVMIRSGIKLTETHDEDKFATRFIVRDEVDTASYTGSNPGDAGSLGAGNSGNQPTGPQRWVAKTSKWKSSDTKKPTMQWVPHKPQGTKPPNRYTINLKNQSNLQYLFIGAPTNPDRVTGKFTFPGYPRMTFNGTRYKKTNNSIVWEGTWTAEGWTPEGGNIGNLDRSAPDSLEPDEAAVADNEITILAASERSGQEIGSQISPSNTASRYRTYNTDKTAAHVATINFQWGRGSGDVVTKLKIPDDKRLQDVKKIAEGHDGSDDIYVFPDVPHSTNSNGTGPSTAPVISYQGKIFGAGFGTFGFGPGRFVVRDYQPPGGGSPTTGGTTPTGGSTTPSIPVVNQVSFKEIKYYTINPKNKNVQKAFGIVTKRFNLEEYTGSSSDKSLVIKKKLQHARKYIEDAWRPQYTLSFTTSGVLGLWANSYVYVNSRSTTVAGLFLVKGIKYTISKRQIVMAVDVDVTRKSIISPTTFSAGFDKYWRY